MSINLPNVFTMQFSAQVEVLLQEQGSKLRPHVMSGTHVGKQASPVNQVGAIAAQPVVSQSAPKNRTDATMTRRWVFPQSFEVDQSIDTFDQLRTIVDPKTAYAHNASLAFGRQVDDLLITATTATAYIGETGTGTEAFDTTNYQVANNFGASAAVGLTVAKMIEIKRIYRKAFVDLENDPATMVIGSTQESNLLNQTEVVSTEFNSRPVLVDGQVRQFLGFNIVVSERLAGGGSGNDRTLLSFVRSGMYLGVWSDMQSDAHQRFDLQGNPWELTTTGTWGATRLQQGKVVTCLARE